MPLCGFTSSRAGAEHLNPCHGSVIALYAFAVTARLAMTLEVDLESPSAFEFTFPDEEILERKTVSAVPPLHVVIQTDLI